MLKVSALALLILGLSACGSATGMTAENNRAAVLEADGSYTFYAGRGVGDVIASGGSVGEDYANGFMALKVPASFYAEAQQATPRVKTASLEVADPSIEMIVHLFNPGSTLPQTLYFH